MPIKALFTLFNAIVDTAAGKFIQLLVIIALGSYAAIDQYAFDLTPTVGTYHQKQLDMLINYQEVLLGQSDTIIDFQAILVEKIKALENQCLR